MKTKYFVESVARQEKDHWCWAACVQMVLNYQGVDVDQDVIVLQAFGSRINKGGTCYDIARGANGWYTRNHVINARVESSYSATAQSFINDLVNKYPLIIGLDMPGQTEGHAYVLTGISFKKVNGEYKPIEVILRDPWPTNSSRKKIPCSDFRKRVHTILNLAVSYSERLDDEKNIALPHNPHIANLIGETTKTDCLHRQFCLRGVLR